MVILWLAHLQHIASKLAAEGERAWRVTQGRVLWARLRVAIDHFQPFFTDYTSVIWPHLPTRETGGKFHLLPSMRTEWSGELQAVSSACCLTFSMAQSHLLSQLIRHMRSFYELQLSRNEILVIFYIPPLRFHIWDNTKDFLLPKIPASSLRALCEELYFPHHCCQKCPLCLSWLKMKRPFPLWDS